MWYSHLKKVVEKKTEISELDTILGKKEEEDLDKETIGNLTHFSMNKIRI